MITGWLTNSVRSKFNPNTGYNACSYIFMQTRDYAARKGTREKARKKKVKVVVEKVGFIPHKDRKKVQQKTISPLVKVDDSWRKKAIDDVWVLKYHQKPVYSLKEAIECHRELHHPTMYNVPNAPITAYIDLDMKREKKNRFVEKFTRVIDTPHVFNYGESTRTVLALCKNLEQLQTAKDAGADFAGGTEIIKQIQNGTFAFKEYNHIVAHADILTDMLLIRGLLKKKFPNVKAGTLSTDLGKLVRKFKYGIQYTAVPDQTHKDYGQITTVFGLLGMDMEKLEENFSALVNDIETFRPRPKEFFIQRVRVMSEPSQEVFKVDFKQFLPPEMTEEPDDEPQESVAIISAH